MSAWVSVSYFFCGESVRQFNLAEPASKLLAIAELENSHQQ